MQNDGARTVFKLSSPLLEDVLCRRLRLWSKKSDIRCDVVFQIRSEEFCRMLCQITISGMPHENEVVREVLAEDGEVHVSFVLLHPDVDPLLYIVSFYQHGCHLLLLKFACCVVHIVQISGDSYLGKGRKTPQLFPLAEPVLSGIPGGRSHGFLPCRLVRGADEEDQDVPIPFQFALCYNCGNQVAAGCILPGL